jgi:hypothetical protein
MRHAWLGAGKGRPSTVEIAGFLGYNDQPRRTRSCAPACDIHVLIGKVLCFQTPTSKSMYAVPVVTA